MSSPSRVSLAIGPVTSYSSWFWLGGDFTRLLEKDYDIQVYGLDDPPPECDVALLIKRRLKPEAMEQWMERNACIVYMPVDYYESPGEIRQDRRFLEKCRTCILHCDRLEPFLSDACGNIGRIQHHNKFGLPRPAEYKEKGEVLWIGHFENVPYLMEWMQTRKLPFPVRILSNPNDPRSVQLAKETADRIGVELIIDGDRLNGHVLEKWNPAIQRRRLQQAKAAIDIKGCSRCFAQLTKPATKGQKYVASGIPLAMNADSYTFDYFGRRGFRLADPEDYDYWFSRSYYERTVRESAVLREELSLNNIYRQLKVYIDAAIGEIAETAECSPDTSAVAAAG